MKAQSLVNFLIILFAVGIGVDDIFVIVQSWDNIGGQKKDHRSVPEKMSSALRHAGVSVLVTSVTDICAFAIGSATVSTTTTKLLFSLSSITKRESCIAIREGHGRRKYSL